MDFPINLKSRTFVQGTEEFRQDITLTFKNYIGSFFASLYIGSQVAQHGAENLVKAGVKSTLNQFPGVELESLRVYEENSVTYIDMSLKYRDSIEKFNFSI